jgi:hypothetical protein
VAILLNHDPGTPLAARLDLRGCGPVSAARVFTYAGGGSGGFRRAEAVRSPAAVDVSAAPYSMTVVDLTLAPRR